MGYRIFDYDPYLLPYEADICARMERYEKKRAELVGRCGSLADFADAHEYFGFHKTRDGWVTIRVAGGCGSELFAGTMCHLKFFLI